MEIIVILIYALLMVGVIYVSLLVAGSIANSFTAFNREEERKRLAYQRWYKSLPLEQQYLIDQQNRQRAAVVGLIALGLFGFFDGFFDGDGEC